MRQILKICDKFFWRKVWWNEKTVVTLHPQTRGKPAPPEAKALRKESSAEGSRAALQESSDEWPIVFANFHWCGSSAG